MSGGRAAGARVCASTGLTLAPARGEIGWRVAKGARGALNPPRRGAAGANPFGWGRFDVYGGRTVYYASTRQCAYAEVLAYLRRRLGRADPLAKDAAALGVSIGELVAEIEREWATTGHMVVGHLPRAWRSERSVFELVSPATGWWVCLETPESMRAVERGLEDTLASVGVSSLDLGVLHGGNREATVAIASWVHAQVLDDGSRPHGVVYTSKHATGRAWACWLRRDDEADEPLTVAGENPIKTTDPDLIAVAVRFGLKLW